MCWPQRDCNKSSSRTVWPDTVTLTAQRQTGPPGAELVGGEPRILGRRRGRRVTLKLWMWCVAVSQFHCSQFKNWGGGTRRAPAEKICWFQLSKMTSYMLTVETSENVNLLKLAYWKWFNLYHFCCAGHFCAWLCNLLKEKQVLCRLAFV